MVDDGCESSGVEGLSIARTVCNTAGQNHFIFFSAELQGHAYIEKQ